MKYSFYCKNCGDSFMSNDKEQVKEYRKKHFVKYTSWMGIFQHCPLVETKRGTYARPQLAIMIDEEIALEKAQ